MTCFETINQNSYISEERATFPFKFDNLTIYFHYFKTLTTGIQHFFRRLSIILQLQYMTNWTIYGCICHVYLTLKHYTIHQYMTNWTICVHLPRLFNFKTLHYSLYQDVVNYVTTSVLTLSSRDRSPWLQNLSCFVSFVRH